MRKRQNPPPRSIAPRSTLATAAAPVWTYDLKYSALTTLMVWTFFVLIIVPPNFNYAQLASDSLAAEADQNNLTSKIVLITLLVASCVVIARRSALWLELLRRLNPFYLLFIALAALSVAWSIDPAVTVTGEFHLLVVFLCFTAFTLAGWRPNRFQSVVRSILGTVVVGSVIFALLLPQYGIQQAHIYAPMSLHGTIVQRNYDVAPGIVMVLRGLTLGKNQMGPLASLALLFWFHAWLGKETKTLLALVCAAAAVVCLFWSHSSTSVLAAAFALPFMLMLRHWPRWLRRYVPYILTTFTLLVLLYSLVVLKLIPQLDFLLSPISAITGKDLTFSNRTTIWQIINAQIAQHPLLGTGYSAYWIDEPGSPSEETKRLLHGFYPGEAHNGYLDVMVDFGILGGVCLLGFLFTYLRRALQIMAFDRHLGSLYLALLFHQFWSNLSESHWFAWSSVPFNIIVLAVCTSARTLLQQRFELGAARVPPYAASRAVIT
jgi:exopolysaccharide production protein ExoQ